MRCGFWPLIQWYVYPWSSQSFPKESTARVSSRSITLTNKSNCLKYTVASSLVCTSPLAVITVVGLLDVLMVSNSAEWRSFLLTICILAPEGNTNSPFLRLSCWRSREYPFFQGRLECNLIFLFEPAYVFGTSLFSFSLFMGLVLKFHCVFDLYFSKRWSFLFLDPCLT